MKTFELTPDLVKLLRNSYVNERLSDCEYGAAEIDCKRPYGNSDVELDIAELLGWEVGEELTDEQSKQARSLHQQTPIALRIVLTHGSFEPGTFEAASEYSTTWKRIS